MIPISISAERWNVNSGTDILSLEVDPIRYFQIASWHLPSGLFWIMNILIELDIYAFSPPVGHWYDLKNFKPLDKSLFADSFLPMFPAARRALNHGSTIIPDLTVECTHSLPAPRSTGNPTVLLYRNLYGSLYSHFRRVGSNKTFNAFCNEPHSEAIPISLPDYWALFYALWINLCPRAITLSFDYAKQNPLTSIERLLNFIGEKRSSDAIIKAVDNSSIDSLIKGDSGPDSRFNIRKGDPTEYMKYLQDGDISSIKNIPIMVMDHLSGKKGVNIGDYSDAYLLKLCEEFADTSLPSSVKECFVGGDLLTLSTICRQNFSDNSGCRLLALAAYLTGMLVNPQLEHQECYADSSTNIAFRTILFCLSQGSNQDLIRKFADREIGITPVQLLRLEDLANSKVNIRFEAETNGLQSQIESLKIENELLRQKYIYQGWEWKLKRLLIKLRKILKV